MFLMRDKRRKLRVYRQTETQTPPSLDSVPPAASSSCDIVIKSQKRHAARARFDLGTKGRRCSVAGGTVPLAFAVLVSVENSRGGWIDLLAPQSVLRQKRLRGC